ncbi:peptidase S8/S53 domain-containing protein [Lipomyces oligophaga]|uniref:peptidase S8/S53 domain-containing protein n=1 Tax=Lipomyces oligophaga TaxID=45792 RepID=UPI0034CEB4D0
MAGFRLPSSSRHLGRGPFKAPIHDLLSIFLVLAVSAFTVVTAELNPRSHVLARDYAGRDYFAVELTWPDIHISSEAIALGVPDQNTLTNLHAFAAEYGLRFEEQLGSLRDHYLFSAPKPKLYTSGKEFDDSISHALSKRDQAQYGSVQYFEKLKPKKLHKRFLPREDRPADSALQPIKDIENALDIRDPEFETQWHLLNPYQPGHDINVTGVWLAGNTGSDVVTAIVDDGLDYESDDLRDNFFAKGSYDFNDPGPLPNPKLTDDRHGTRCAGEIAAVRNNACGVGVAYNSKVAGIRILSKEITDADEALALNYRMDVNDIYSCSWGPPDDGKAMDAPGNLIKRAFINGVQNGRGGLGSVYVFASGNGAQNGDNCNFDGYTNSIYSITVGAIDRKGLHPYYAEDCSAQLVVTYSSGSGDHIHTTDVGKNTCTDQHGGTSAAAPIAAGIFALVLSERPDLTWRDVQYLAMETAVQVPNSDGLWQTTAIGKQFSHRYGYGKIDAYSLVERAKKWKNVKPQAWLDTEVMTVHSEIPSGKDGISSLITIDVDALRKANLARLEHVQVTVDIRHQRRGDISVLLESPTGVVSILATQRMFDVSRDGMINWTFMTVAHWGETGVGSWKLTVKDEANPTFTGSLESWNMRIWGEAIDVARAKPFPMPHGNPGEEPTPTDTFPTPTTVTSATETTLTTPEVDPEEPSTTSANITPVESSGLPSSTQDSSLDDEYDDSDPSPDNSKSENSWFNFIPAIGISSDKAIWIYGAALIIFGFVALIIVYLCIQRRNRRSFLRAATHDSSSATGGSGGQEYEFQILRNHGDPADISNALERGRGVAVADGRAGSRRKARDLYNAFENIEEDDAFAVDDLLSDVEIDDDLDDDEGDIGRQDVSRNKGSSSSSSNAGASKRTSEDKERLLASTGH